MSVVTEKTQSLVHTLEFYRKLGIKNVQFKLCRSESGNSNRAEVKRIINLYDELNDFLIRKASDMDFSYLFMILNDNDYYGKIVRRIILQDRSVRRCQAGRNKIAFTAAGDMYPCDSFVGQENHKVGSVEENVEHLKNRLASVTFRSSDKCHECKWRYVCGGDCYHNSFLVNNSIIIPDEEYCNIEVHLIRNALKLIAILSSLDKDSEQLSMIRRQLEIKEKMFA